MNIKTLSFGCRLNALECGKIAKMLSGFVDRAVLVNTCSVTGEAERQCAQTVRKISRENPGVVIFVTGCGATRNPELFKQIPHTIVINNQEKMTLAPYIAGLKTIDFEISCSNIKIPKEGDSKLSKQFIQVQNGCNHDCTYCVTRLLRGNSISFPYKNILNDAKNAIKNGFYEIVLTGVDTASYALHEKGKPFFLSDLCERLLSDVPEIKRLRLSSVDPASPQVPKIIEMMKHNDRFMPHLHLSMQSGSDTILKSMRRRHNSKKLMELVDWANGDITFSADIICGFPGETDELFNETLKTVREMGLIHVHAFPFSPRPGTVAANMPNQIPRRIAKERVKTIIAIVNEIRKNFMEQNVGKTVSVLVEDNNMARTPNDIDIKILGDEIPNKTICDVEISGIEKNIFIGIRK